MQQLLTVAFLDLCLNGIEGIQTGQTALCDAMLLTWSEKKSCTHSIPNVFIDIDIDIDSRDGMKDREIDRHRLSDVWSLCNVNASAGSFRYHQQDLFSVGAIAN